MQWCAWCVCMYGDATGLGSRLLEAVEAKAREASCTHIVIEVVNHRSDLLPFYAKRGFKGTAIIHMYLQYLHTSMHANQHALIGFVDRSVDRLCNRNRNGTMRCGT
jgi:hypothetical protein